jgi:hypothetical protein
MERLTFMISSVRLNFRALHAPTRQSNHFRLSPKLTNNLTSHNFAICPDSYTKIAMASFQLLDQQEEDKLHKTRLLAIEEKPFKRITKRLLTPGSLTFASTKLPPTPPPDSAGDEDTSTQENLLQKQLEERRKFQDDVILDFAAFDSSIARLQFLHKSNEAERSRYRSEKDRIVTKAQEVKDNTVELRIALENARQTMEQRKKFDELAEKILTSKLLRPRADQELNLHKLEEEIRQLENESKQYSETWKERREQFGRIVEEGLRMRRLIRDEKEEVERREGMDVEEEDGEVGEGAESGSRGGATPKHSSQSGGATPRPENPATPLPDGASSRPDSSDGASTQVQHDSHRDGLKPRPLPAVSLSRPGSRVGSRASSRASVARRREEPEEGEDIMMVETEARMKDADSPMADVPESNAGDSTQPETPLVTVDEPVEAGTMDKAAPIEDRMDTT